MGKIKDYLYRLGVNAGFLTLKRVDEGEQYIDMKSTRIVTNCSSVGANIFINMKASPHVRNEKWN